MEGLGDIYFQFLLTASFWLIPSFFWKSSLASEREEDQEVNSQALNNLVNAANTQPDLQEKTSGCLLNILLKSRWDNIRTVSNWKHFQNAGVVTALVTAGPADLYNRVLCPTCILQIIAINTLLVRCHLLVSIQ